MWDIAAESTQWFGDLSPLLGLPAGQFGGSFGEYATHVHPEDRAEAKRRFVACLKGQTPTYVAEERVVWPDGSVHWLETHGRGEYDAIDGRAWRLVGVVIDMTERKRAEEARLEQATRFQRLIDDAPVAIGVSRHAQVVYGNPSFLRMFKVPALAVLEGMRVLDLVAPQDRPLFERRTAQRQGQLPVENHYEMLALRLDGVAFACEITVMETGLQQDPETLVFVTDISERQRMVAALQHERNRATQYLQMAQSILVAFDADARITLLNRKGYQVLGYPEGSLVGQDWFRVCLPAEEYEPVMGVFRSLMRGELAPFEYFENHVLTRSGERRYIAWRNVLIHDDSGAISGTLSSGEDITERRRAEQALIGLNQDLEGRVSERTQQLEATNEALASAVQAAEAATRAKSEFLANMSHEIRTPMNAILGLTGLALRAQGLDPKVQSHLKNVKAAADSLLGIINDVLDFSKIESGKLEIEHREFELQTVLDRVTAMVALNASEKGLDFLLSTDADVPYLLVGDPLRLGQILLNLCSNAVKFTEQGEIVVVTVKADMAQAGRVGLRFSVRDTGIGMAEAQVERLFQPFEQLDPSTSRKYGGTGLGLAICKQLVEMMGGQIGARSAPGKGSEFFFTLGFEVPPSAKVAGAAPLRGVAARRVLVVDDSAQARTILSALLETLGWRSTVTASAAAGLAELERAAQDDPYEVVLLDWKMPGEDGYSAARSVRASASLPGLPALVLVTAYGDDEVARNALEAGFDAYLAKPVTPDALRATLSRITTRPSTPVAVLSRGTGVERASPPSAPDPIEQIKGRRILLVEDNELNRIVATELLGGVAGAVLEVAESGEQALLKLGSAAPELVLMDVQMPGLDGYDTARLIRSDARWGAVPIVAMTAHAMARDHALCLAAGMNDVIVKPFEPHTLFKAVARWLPATVGLPPPRASSSPRSGQAPNASISFESGLSRCLGRVELYHRVLSRFLELRQGDSARLSSALARGDPETVAQIAHDVVSTAGAIGADALSLAAAELQNAAGAASRGEAADWRTPTAMFKQLHLDALRQLREHLGVAEPLH